uniref:Copine 5 n=1 Tax=Apteryx owenii TaxID=8824 RepID=A0A8B9QN76_APTOW
MAWSVHGCARTAVHTNTCPCALARGVGRTRLCALTHGAGRTRLYTHGGAHRHAAWGAHGCTHVAVHTGTRHGVRTAVHTRRCTPAHGSAHAAVLPATPRASVSSPARRPAVSRRHLLDKDTFSKSDPLCVLYTQGAESKQWREFGRTEVIDNTLNPDFVRKFILDYFFEEKQNLRFDLYDVDSKSPDLSKHDFLGQAFCTLGEIVGSAVRGRGRPPGIPGKKCGTIILLAEELGNCRDVATLQFCANKLDKKDFFGKSDPFMVFYRSNEDGTFTICHKTEVVRNTLNPVWQAFAIPVRALCNGDYDRHDFIGEFTTSYRELARGQSQFNVYEVVNPKKKMKKKKYLNSGTVTLLSFAVESDHTFLDYIKGGTQINFTVAIDFTASNGNPSQSTSLHYMNPYQLNAYTMALKAVGEIIQDYDSDKMFPALGFGAKIPPDGRVSHEFPLNGNAANPSCSGIEGILEAYHKSLKSVQLYGPTNFAPVVNHVARSAAAVPDGSQYFVLLIITDGVISDMAQTKEAIVNSVAPTPPKLLSSPLAAMVELDGDDIRISSRGKVAERDIVQFVPFRDYIDRTGNQVLSMARLAKDVLAEIPDQFISYMKGWRSNAAPPASAPTCSPRRPRCRRPGSSPRWPLRRSLEGGDSVSQRDVNPGSLPSPPTRGCQQQAVSPSRTWL